MHTPSQMNSDHSYEMRKYAFIRISRALNDFPQKMGLLLVNHNTRSYWMRFKTTWFLNADSYSLEHEQKIGINNQFGFWKH